MAPETTRSWLAEHPKLMGALCSLALLVTSTGTAMAGGSMVGP